MFLFGFERSALRIFGRSRADRGPRGPNRSLVYLLQLANRQSRIVSTGRAGFLLVLTTHIYSMHTQAGNVQPAPTAALLHAQAVFVMGWFLFLELLIITHGALDREDADFREEI